MTTAGLGDEAVTAAFAAVDVDGHQTRSTVHNRIKAGAAKRGWNRHGVVGLNVRLLARSTAVSFIGFVELGHRAVGGKRVAWVEFPQIYC